MAKSTETKDVAVKETTAVGEVIDFSTDAGSGFEEMDSDCFAIPFLTLLQKMSPQCDEMEGSYIEGAKSGDFFNTASGKIYKGKDGILIIPCAFVHKYNLWVPNRGGYRGSVTPLEYMKMSKETRTNDKGKREEFDQDGNVITNTMEHYVLIVNPDGTTEPALLTMTSTQLKKSKKWNTLAQAICGTTKPSYSQMYRLTSVPESNDFGSWAGIKIDHESQVTSREVYESAKAFREMVRSGAAKASEIDGDDLPY